MINFKYYSFGDFTLNVIYKSKHPLGLEFEAFEMNVEGLSFATVVDIYKLMICRKAYNRI